MKFLGHPIHVMLIHFPTALFPMDLACSIVGYFTNGISFIHASFYAMIGGAALGCCAIITGTFDLLNVINEKSSVIKKALLHGSINGTVVIVYIVLAFNAFKRYPQLEPDGIAKIILKGGLITFMILGNYLGGSLILKDKIGIEK
jgi:uncharacterized membrane protein